MFEDSQIGDTLVVRLLEPRLDAYVAVKFRNRMREYQESGNNQFVLDLAEVDFIDSSGLGALVSVLKSTDSAGRLALCNLGESIVSMLRLTRMDQIFTIYSDVEQATGATH
tara:strand:+ start:1521 stop:1853 length:333 start_codon:yes stop_codon:yes gene_type:complete